ncbi:lysophospholipid acyltransferase family protein [Haloferula chungangensis]|uniref:Lysophospholipid acyltransferase family protein n=1 Tax=Haloferula chungangensis TaxID=1048331 RepID=A0ABW2L5H9_9BACT
MPPIEPSIVRDSRSIPVATRSWWWWPLETLAMGGGILYWGVFGLLFTLVSLPLRIILPRRRAQILGRSLLHRAFRVFVHYLRITGLVQVDLNSLAPLRQKSEPIIIAPNHTSLWDAVFVIACLPQPICIMKESILCNPFLGGGARLAGYIPNSSPARLVRKSAESLSHGGQLLLFPEGTRTRRDARWINPLRGGCALIARRAKVPVLPVYVRSNTRFLEKGWPLWKRPDFPLKLSFELGTAVVPKENESAKAFTNRLSETYIHNLSRPHKLRRQIEVE